MKTEVVFCAPEDNLMRVADLMRLRDCGAIPIVEQTKVVGILTDRDVCLAVAARNRKASDVKAADLLKSKIIVCCADDDLESALRKMRKYQIKRLVVVDESNELVGILSIADLVLSVHKDKKLKKKIYAALKAIVQPRPIVLREISESSLPADENFAVAPGN
ncbi:MAG: CBS domain-containing protein [Acidobacteriota bacterium]|nr:CBS domain-containing protein [Acidobacteriota bacterium]